MKKIVKFLVLILLFGMYINITSAEEFKINKLTYSLIYFYKCFDGKTSLTSSDFILFTQSLNTSQILNKYYINWADNETVSIDSIYTSDYDGYFLRNTSRFRLELNDKSRAYITLTPDYYFVTYDLDLNGKELNLRSRSFSVENNIGISEYVNSNLYSIRCKSEIGIILYNIYDYSGKVECLKKENIVYDCLNDSNYNKITQEFDFPLIDKEEDRIHEPISDQVWILDKGHLNSNIDTSTTRIIVLSNGVIMRHLISSGIMVKLVNLLLDLRQMPVIIDKLQKLDDEYTGYQNESEILLNQYSSYTADRFADINESLIDLYYEKTKNGKNELNFLSKTPKRINDKLKIDDYFYIDYYSKFIIFYLDKNQQLADEMNNKFDDIQQNINKMREKKPELRDRYITQEIEHRTWLIAVIGGFLALIQIIVSVSQIIKIPSRKESNKQYKYFQEKIRELSKSLEKIQKNIKPKK